jgi:hypothetical protein
MKKQPDKFVGLFLYKYMLISHLYQFVYFAPTKTGSTSISSVLMDNFVAEEFAVDEESEKTTRHAMWFPKEFEHYTTFASVRNPFTRALSLYNFFKEPHETIWEFADRRQSRSVYEWLWPEQRWSDRPIPEGCVPVRLDNFVRLESLSDDFHNLPFVDQEVVFPHYTPSYKTRVAYPPLLQDLVRETCREDFELFGYDIEEVLDFGLRMFL